MNTPSHFTPAIRALVPLTCALSDKLEAKAMALHGNTDWEAWCKFFCASIGELLATMAEFESKLRKLEGTREDGNDSFPE